MAENPNAGHTDFDVFLDPASHELRATCAKPDGLQTQLEREAPRRGDVLYGATERERKERQQREKNYNVRGRSLACLAPRELHQFMRSVDLREVDCLTISPDGQGALCAMRDGICLFCQYAPPVELRKRSESAGRIVALALGTHGRFFLRYAAGSVQYHGPDELAQAVDGKPVDSVAFGEHWHSFVVLYSDGSAFWFRAPPPLQELLREREDAAFVSLGPAGQWFVRFRNHSWRAGGLANQEDKFLKECMLRDNGEAREITFGCEAMIVRYNSGGNQLKFDSHGQKRSPLDYRNKIWFCFSSRASNGINL